MARAKFDDLCDEREALRNFVGIHASSLLSFKDNRHPWFRRQEARDSGKRKKRKVHHLTTTASCLESLDCVPVYDVDEPPAPCPRNGPEVSAVRAKILGEFTNALLPADDDEWQSEGQLLIYCRVRTLPVILRLADDETLEKFKPQLAHHLDFVWKGLKVSDIRAQGIAEHPGKEAKPGEGYPPNAFHTYWAVRLLHEYRKKNLLEPPSPGLRAKEAVAQLWARRTLAAQTALISGDQQSFDAHQLAWALSTDVLCRASISDGDQPTTADHQHIELYEAALKAFFSEQEKGRWRLYEPLFHYSQAGNAYCYTYETLAELLSLALMTKSGRVIRDQLREYSEELIAAWHYAKETALELESGGLGWCSGHHPHRTHPEAWATAAVFAYLQNLRCLIGHWTADEAKSALSVRQSDAAAVEVGQRALGERGKTWHRDGTQTVGRQLATLFLHPLRATARKHTTIDPDRPLVDESRSAVLFGPPGTGKTSLVSSLAKALEWDFVEVLASDFLRDGMDSVPRLADEIFQKLMELDHCVILFDEIDELIRMRDKDGSDPFGRFLTTSMLPKLAKLWEQRRVLFFVATNDIEAADPAIKRSQRIDAAIFVPPPSFETKLHLLKKKGHEPSELTPENVRKALTKADSAKASLGVFAFLRYDQVGALAHRISVFEREDDLEPDSALEKALRELGEEMRRTDWQRSEDTPSGDPPENFSDIFDRWNTQNLDERRDHRNAAVLKLSDDLDSRKPSDWETYKGAMGYVVIGPEVYGGLKPTDEGILKLEAGSWTGIDKTGICVFEVES